MTEIRPGMLISGYSFLEQVGEGGFSSVWKVRSLQYDSLFVAKITKIKDADIERAWNAFDSEIQALMRLSHPHIISLYGHFRYENNFVMILEYLSNGSLDEYLTKRGPLSGPGLIKVIKDVGSALNYCWTMGVQHRDIKPGNIMFDENGRAKLVDFGISTIKKVETQESMRISNFACSMICAAPEILDNLPYNPVRSDIWAMGITILWMVRGTHPWGCRRMDELTEAIQCAHYMIPSGMDIELVRMVKKMLSVIPEERVFPSDEELSQLGGSSGVGQTRVHRRIVPSASRPSSTRGGVLLVSGRPLASSSSPVGVRLARVICGSPIKQWSGSKEKTQLAPLSPLIP